VLLFGFICEKRKVKTVDYGVPCPWDDFLADQELPKRETLLNDQEAMMLALRVSGRGLGHVSPNPLVGAVILDRNAGFLAAGAHEVCGQGHAEVNALAAVDDKSKLLGASLFVTLEPCSHVGRTPSCAKMLAELPFERIVYAVNDPNPQVDGRGAKILAQAGKNVVLQDELAKAVAELNRVFFWRQKNSSVFVGLKVATSLNGMMGRAGDQRRWLTGARARQFGHFLRLHYDAIAIGASTLMGDNPSLTPYRSNLGTRAPWRVVIDPHLRAAEASDLSALNILRAEPEKVIWIYAEGATSARLAELACLGVACCPLAARAGRIAAQDILSLLKSFAIESLLLEGGAGLYRAFLDERLVQRLHMFMAPQLLLGTDALPWATRDLLPTECQLDDIVTYQLEKDLLLEASVHGSCAPSSSSSPPPRARRI